jgi:hypothetical protein
LAGLAHQGLVFLLGDHFVAFFVDVGGLIVIVILVDLESGRSYGRPF